MEHRVKHQHSHVPPQVMNLVCAMRGGSTQRFVREVDAQCFLCEEVPVPGMSCQYSSFFASALYHLKVVKLLEHGATFSVLNFTVVIQHESYCVILSDFPVVLTQFGVEHDTYL